MMTAVQNRTKESDGGERIQGFEKAQEEVQGIYSPVLPEVKYILYVIAVPQQLSLQEWAFNIDSRSMKEESDSLMLLNQYIIHQHSRRCYK